MMKVKDWPEDIEIQESHRQKSDVTSDETSFLFCFLYCKYEVINKEM